MGSYMEHLTAKDEAAKDRLMKGLAGFLDRDRTLFDLSPKPVSITKTKLLGDSATVTEILDHLLHHGHNLKCGPRSWRTKTGLPSPTRKG